MKRLLVRGTAVTSFVFLLMWALSGITSLNVFSAFDPFSQALGEFELTDYAFSKLRADPVPDERIVVVNLGPDRRTIAHQVNTISRHRPRVIGIDSFFDCEGGFYDTVACPQLLDTLGNLMLANAISEAANVVLVSRLLQSDSLFNSNVIDEYDSVERSDLRFRQDAVSAYANFVTNATYQDDVKACKSFIPTMEVNGQTLFAFSVAVAMHYDSAKAKALLARKNHEELINFRGNINIDDVRVKNLRGNMHAVSEFNALCYAIDWMDVVKGEFDPSLFKDKIVLMGSLGEYFGDPSWEDKFFTPLNSRVAGRANPDMFGIVVHANVIAMILNGDYIEEISYANQVIIAILICFFNVLLFNCIDSRFPYLFDGLSVILQVLQIVIVSAIVVFVFNSFQYKLELSLSIGVLALVGPCYDICKSIESTWHRRFRKREPIQSSPIEQVTP